MYQIRKAVPDDALGITLVNVTTWETAYTGLVPEKLIDERIAALIPRAEKSRRDIEDGGHYLVAEDGGTVIGFCMFGACRDERYRGAGEIVALYTLAGYQGQGAGTALFNAALETMKTEGFSTVIVNCLRGNPALRFYEHLGGCVIGQWEHDAGEYRMEGDVLRFAL
ncbi:MAG: GNAT family N-acetyltransferase [Eubacteriales bacterium]|nr:GNAT family N-acetyltransferase [Eubacteriales bacterium]